MREEQTQPQTTGFLENLSLLRSEIFGISCILRVVMGEALYRHELIEEAREPRHFGRMANANAVFEAANPVCGDELTIFLKLDKSRRKVVDASFDGRGCMVMMASTSRLLDSILGKTVASVKKISPEKVLEIFGAPLTSSRQECALLPLLAVQQMSEENGNAQRNDI